MNLLGPTGLPVTPTDPTRTGPLGLDFDSTGMTGPALGTLSNVNPTTGRTALQLGDAALSVKGGYGAASDGTTNDSAAVLAASVAGGVLFASGVTRIATAITIASPTTVYPGAHLLADGVQITLPPAFSALDVQCLYTINGGSFVWSECPTQGSNAAWWGQAGLPYGSAGQSGTQQSLNVSAWNAAQAALNGKPGFVTTSPGETGFNGPLYACQADYQGFLQPPSARWLWGNASCPKMMLGTLSDTAYAGKCWGKAELFRTRPVSDLTAVQALGLCTHDQLASTTSVKPTLSQVLASAIGFVCWGLEGFDRRDARTHDDLVGAYMRNTTSFYGRDYSAIRDSAGVATATGAGLSTANDYFFGEYLDCRDPGESANNSWTPYHPQAADYVGVESYAWVADGRPVMRGGISRPGDIRDLRPVLPECAGLIKYGRVQVSSGTLDTDNIWTAVLLDTCRGNCVLDYGYGPGCFASIEGHFDGGAGCQQLVFVPSTNGGQLIVGGEFDGGDGWATAVGVLGGNGGVVVKAGSKFFNLFENIVIGSGEVDWHIGTCIHDNISGQGTTVARIRIEAGSANGHIDKQIGRGQALAMLQFDSGATGYSYYAANLISASATYTHDIIDNGTPAAIYGGGGGGSTTDASTLTTGTLPAGRLPALTGDITTTVGTAATTLASTGIMATSYGSATQVPQITFDGKGRATAASLITITPAWSSIGSKPTTLSGFGITDAVNVSLLGVSSGVATLDGSGKVLSSQLPASGSYKGAWNASTNTPTITSGSGTSGDFYFVGTAGTTTIDGGSTWSVGDQIRFSGTVWQRIPSSSSVTSVNGYTGSVTIGAGDLTTGTLLAARLPAFTGDATSSAGSSALTLAATGVTAATYGSATQSLVLTVDAKGRATSVSAMTVTPAWTSVTGKPSFATVATSGLASDLTGTLAAAQLPAHTGDATSSAGSAALTIAAGAVTLAKMANLAANSLVGNNTGSAATPLALTAAQVKTLLAIGPSDVSGLAAVASSGSASDLGAGTLPVGRLPALSGDIATSLGSSVTALAASGVTAGTYGDGTHVPQITLDAKGRATSVSAVAITATGGANTALSNTIIPAPDGTSDSRTMPSLVADLGRSIRSFFISTDTDWTNAMSRAQSWLATQAATAGSAPTLVWPPGVYIYSTSPNWAISNTNHLVIGDVRLRYTGTGNAMIFDAGSAAQIVTGVNTFGAPFIIEAPSTAQNGIYWRSVHHSDIGATVRGCGTTYAGLRVDYAVCTKFRFICSSNEAGGFYAPSGVSAKPGYGIWLDKRNAGETTAYCTFDRPILEGLATAGAYLNYAEGCSFLTGTMEGVSGHGCYISSGSLKNKFFNVDFEANTTDDIYCDGYHNHFFGCDSTSKFIVGGNGKKNRVIGGDFSAITMNSGATLTLLSGVLYNRLNDGSVITDNGTLTRFRDIINFGTGAVGNAPPARRSVTAGTSPYTYTNAGGNDEIVYMYNNGYVTAMTFTRSGAGANDFVQTIAQGILLSPGDALNITWNTTAPTLNISNR